MNFRSLAWAVRWFITIGSILLLILTVDFRKIPGILLSADLKHIAAAFLLALAHFAVGAWRWQKLTMLMSGKMTSWKALFDTYLMSFVLSNTLPGTITGDALRIYNTRKITNGGSMAAAIVLLERILGFFILALLGMIFWSFLPSRPSIPIRYPSWIYVGISCCLILFFFLVFQARFRKMGYIFHWLCQFITILGQFPYLALRKPMLASQALAGSFFFQLFSLLIVFESLRATQENLSLFLFLCIAPIITIILLLPISVQGIGIREYLYLLFLLPSGKQADSILAGLTLTYVIGVPFIIWGWILFHRHTRELIRFQDAV